jgi:quercetin dioxygenase-like cupin family protein
VTSPVGGDAARAAAIPISEGFNLGYCKAKPGHGPMMHNHDTNETFIPMTGKWRCSWENEMGKVEHVDLDPLDVISFPAGAIRRLENVTSGDRDQENILMFVIGGNGPRAEFTDQAMQELAMAALSYSRRVASAPRSPPMPVCARIIRALPSRPRPLAGNSWATPTTSCRSTSSTTRRR